MAQGTIRLPPCSCSAWHALLRSQGTSRSHWLPGRHRPGLSFQLKKHPAQGLTHNRPRALSEQYAGTCLASKTQYLLSQAVPHLTATHAGRCFYSPIIQMKKLKHKETYNLPEVPHGRALDTGQFEFRVSCSHSSMCPTGVTHLALHHTLLQYLSIDF